MSDRQEPPSGAAVVTPSIGTWAAFLLMCLGMFMAILDIQIVATSLPAIQQALAISQDAMSWIQTSYLIAEVIAIPLTGLFTRVLTLRWLVAAAVALFTLASIGCAYSGGFAVLLVFRVVQGFAGGVLIPAVFTAVFLLFPPRLHAVATTIGGVVAVLAPTVGPVVGGWITETWSWPWLFLINVIPGLIVTSVTPFLLPRQDTDFAELAKLDGGSLLLLAAALAGLEIGLKEAPHHGWLSPDLHGLVGGKRGRPGSFCPSQPGRQASGGAACYTAAAFVCGRLRLELLPWRRPVRLGLSDAGLSRLRAPSRCLRDRHHHAGDRDRAAHRRPHRRDPGKPDRRARLTGAGFALFALGLGLSAIQPRTADFDEMFWPQIVRGVAIMFCLLPPTRIALGALPEIEVADASGLFNLMRNLGGAIGIALIDTILYGRSAIYAEDFRVRLLAGDVSAAKAIGLDPALLANRPPGPPDAAAVAFVRPMVEKASLALCVNEAWAMLACVAIAGVLLVPFARDRLDPAGS